jgi:hydroxymethylpyrimidine pyrophosphatase-like HAD family hydrolase
MAIERQQNFIWEMSRQNQEVIGKQNRICGTLVLDMDGTLTAPKQDYAIEPEVITELTDFLAEGGNLVFNTGATAGRIERTLLSRLYCAVDEKYGLQKTDSVFNQVFLNPENGSALLIKKEIKIEENELLFDWHRVHELHVPNKDLIRKALEEDVIPMNKDSYLLGDWTKGPNRRDYIVTLKNIKNTLELKKEIESDLFRKQHPEIDWKNVLIKAARTSVDFIHKDSGKTISVAWLLKELSLTGPVIGFGDLGDEFAKVVPTFNVNGEKLNEFRIRGMPAMDIVGGWSPLSKKDHVIIDIDGKTVVRDQKIDRVIPVLRDNQNKIILSENGQPIEIKPLKVRGNNGEEKILAGAGKSTAWMIHRLVEIGYFDCDKICHGSNKV